MRILGGCKKSLKLGIRNTINTQWRKKDTKSYIQKQDEWQIKNTVDNWDLLRMDVEMKDKEAILDS